MGELGEVEGVLYEADHHKLVDLENEICILLEKYFIYIYTVFVHNYICTVHYILCIMSENCTYFHSNC